MSTSRSTRSGEPEPASDSPFGKGGARRFGATRLLLVSGCCAALLLAVAGCSRGLSDRPLAEVIAAAEKGDAPALRELVVRFGDPDPVLAQQAWEAAVKIGAPVVPECISALSAKDRNIGEHAAGALGALQAKEAVDGLMAALARPDFRRYAAAWALGEIADARAIPALVRALGDADPETRKFATRSLTKFGPLASDALLAALTDPAAPVRRYAVRALGQIQERRAVEPLLALEGQVDLDVLLWAFGRLGDLRGLPLLERSAGGSRLEGSSRGRAGPRRPRGPRGGPDPETCARRPGVDRARVGGARARERDRAARHLPGSAWE